MTRSSSPVRRIPSRMARPATPPFTTAGTSRTRRANAQPPRGGCRDPGWLPGRGRPRERGAGRPGGPAGGFSGNPNQDRSDLDDAEHAGSHQDHGRDRRLAWGGVEESRRHVYECHGSKQSKPRSEEHTSELQSPCNLVCRLLLEKKKKSFSYCIL